MNKTSMLLSQTMRTLSKSVSRSSPFMVLHVGNDGTLFNLTSDDDSKSSHKPPLKSKRTFADYFANPIASKFEASLRTALRTEETQVFEYESDSDPHRHYEARIVPNTQIGSIVILHEKLPESGQTILEEQSKEEHKIVDSIKHIVLQTDSELNITFLNSAWKQTTGIESSFAIGCPLTEFIHEDDRETLSVLIQAAHSNETIRSEVRLVKKDGTPHWFEFAADTMTDTSGLITGFTGTLSDINELKSEHKKLESNHGEVEIHLRNRIVELEEMNRALVEESELADENERKMLQTQLIQRTLLDNLPEPMWLKDIDGHYIGVNHPFAELYGHSDPDRIVGQSSFDLMEKEVAEKSIADDLRVIQSKRTVKRDELICDLTGKAAWYEVTKRPIFNEHGDVIGIFGVARNIDERLHEISTLRSAKLELEEVVQQRTFELRKAFDDLQASESYFRALIQDQTEMLGRIGSDGTLLFVNEKLCSYFSLPHEKLISHRLVEFIGEKQYTRFHDKIRSLTPDSPTTTVLWESINDRKEYQATSWVLHGFFYETQELCEVQMVGRDLTEQILTEKSLNEKQQQIDDLVQHVNAILWEYDTTRYCFTYVSNQVEAMLGISPEAWLKDPTLWLDLVHPEDRETAIRKFDIPPERTVTTRAFEYRIRTLDGRDVWALDKVTYDPESTLLHGVILDITERKRADQIQTALLEITKSYGTAHNLEEMLSVFHEQLSKLMVARNFYVALYHPDLELYSFPYYVDPFDEPILTNAYHKLDHSLTDYVRRTGKPLLADQKKMQELLEAGEIDIVGRHANCWLGVPLQTQRGIIGVCAIQSYLPGKEYSLSDLELIRFVASNISSAIELKFSEEERKRLVAAIEAASESIALLDINDVILYANPAFQKITGYTPAEAINKNRIELLKPNEDDPRQNEDMSRVSKKGEEWRGTQTIRTKEGTLLYLESTLSPIRDDKGRVVNIIKVDRDITREHILEDQLRQSQKLEAIGQLAGGIAHDFNNLLTAIIGNISLAKIGTPEQIQACLDDAERASSRASGLVKQILTFSRRSDMQVEVTDLAIILDEISSMVRNTIDRKIDFTVSYDNLHSQVIADTVQLHQVILNLCVNARDALLEVPDEKFARVPPKLQVIAEDIEKTLEDIQENPNARPGKFVKVAVIDNGAGMSQETMQRIFEPFFTTKPTGVGTGLGLATVYGIIKQHNGWLEVISEVGKGSTFTFYLPVAEQVVIQSTSVGEPMLSTGNETILVVDDEDLIRTISRSVLEQLGYKVITIETGKEAIEYYKANQSDISMVILDYSMPKMSGGELLQELLAINPKIKAIISSGYDTHTMREYQDVKLAKNFISKPFQIDVLAQTIRKVLDTQ